MEIDGEEGAEEVGFAESGAHKHPIASRTHLWRGFFGVCCGCLCLWVWVGVGVGTTHLCLVS